MNIEAHGFCINYVKETFYKWDKDRSGVLDKQELKNWLKHEIKEAPLRAKHVRRGFDDLIKGADRNRDGKVDRWELYEHCMKNYNGTSEDE